MTPEDIPTIIHDQLLQDAQAREFAADVLGIMGMADYLDADMCIMRMHGIWTIKVNSGTYQGADFAKVFNLLRSKTPGYESMN